MSECLPQQNGINVKMSYSTHPWGSMAHQALDAQTILVRMPQVVVGFVVLMQHFPAPFKISMSNKKYK